MCRSQDSCAQHDKLGRILTELNDPPITTMFVYNAIRSRPAGPNRVLKDCSARISSRWCSTRS